MCSSTDHDAIAAKLRMFESGLLGVLHIAQAQIHWTQLNAGEVATIVPRPIPWPGPIPVNPGSDKCDGFMPFASWPPAGDGVSIRDSLALSREWLGKLVDLCDDITGDLPDLG